MKFKVTSLEELQDGDYLYVLPEDQAFPESLTFSFCAVGESKGARSLRVQWDWSENTFWSQVTALFPNCRILRMRCVSLGIEDLCSPRTLWNYVPEDVQVEVVVAYTPPKPPAKRHRGWFGTFSLPSFLLPDDEDDFKTK